MLLLLLLLDRVDDLADASLDLGLRELLVRLVGIPVLAERLAEAALVGFTRGERIRHLGIEVLGSLLVLLLVEDDVFDLGVSAFADELLALLLALHLFLEVFAARLRYNTLTSPRAPTGQ